MRELPVRTRARRELVDITAEVAAATREGGDGVWLVYVPHTTAGVMVNEGADPSVATDIVKTSNYYNQALVDILVKQFGNVSSSIW